MPLKAGHHRPTSKTPFKWCFAGGLNMAQHGMLAQYLCDFSVLLRNPTALSFSRGGGVQTPHHPSGSVHVMG